MEDFRAPGGKERLGTVLRILVLHLEAEGACAASGNDSGKEPVLSNGPAQSETLSSAFVTLLQGLSSSSHAVFMEVFFKYTSYHEIVFIKVYQHNRRSGRKAKSESGPVDDASVTCASPAQWLPVYLLDRDFPSAGEGP